MPDSAGLYSLKMRGRSLKYELHAAKPFGAMCDVVSDLTGYRSDAVAQGFRRMKISEERTITPMLMADHGVPKFIIKRVA